MKYIATIVAAGLMAGFVGQLVFDPRDPIWFRALAIFTFYVCGAVTHWAIKNWHTVLSAKRVIDTNFLDWDHPLHPPHRQCACKDCRTYFDDLRGSRKFPRVECPHEDDTNCTMSGGQL